MKAIKITNEYKNKLLALSGAKPVDLSGIYEAIKELEELEARKCTNCKHFDEVKGDVISCHFFEECLPVEIGKCDKWEGK